MRRRPSNPNDGPTGSGIDELAGGDEELRLALQRVRTELIGEPDRAIASAQLRAILLELAEGDEPPRVGAWRRRAASVAGLGIAKLAVGASIAAAATGGGLAATGNLPDPAQRAVADIAERVGVVLPVPDRGESRSERGAERGRDDEVRRQDPGRPAEPGRPDSPGRSTDAPGRSEAPRRPESPGRSGDEVTDPSGPPTAPGRSAEAPRRGGEPSATPRGPEAPGGGPDDSPRAGRPQDP